MSGMIELPVHVRAENGSRGDQAWVRRADLPFRQRLREAGILMLIGLGLGLTLLFVPLIHILGVFFALACTAFAIHRLRGTQVLAAAGGVCPRCGQESRFFVGFGRRRFRLPAVASCAKCGSALTLTES